MPTLQVACNAKLEEERVDQLVGDLVDLVVLYTSTPRHFVSVLVLQEQYMSVGGNSDDVCVEVRSLRPTSGRTVNEARLPATQGLSLGRHWDARGLQHAWTGRVLENRLPRHVPA
jgi:hypothetical protein